jgi:hypothetical protein
MAAMNGNGLMAEVGGFAERESLLPDLRRALRTTAAFMAPLLLARFGVLTGPVVFAAIAAETVALLDVRGAYYVPPGSAARLRAASPAPCWPPR